MQEGRLFQILYYLLEHGQTNAQALAQHLEVSIRTIYRDIDRISSAGIPIYVTTGRKGGIQIQNDYILNKALFTKENIQDVMIGVQSLSATQYLSEDETLMKLQAVFKQPAMNWLDVDFTRWGSNRPSEKLLFQHLKQAVIAQKEISFDYVSTAGNREKRHCWPLKLQYKENAWYVHGYCCTRQDVRLFRISRMRNLTIQHNRFDSMKLQAKTSLPSPEDIGPLTAMEFHFPQHVAYRAFDVFSEESISQHEQKLIVKTVLPLNEWIYSFLLSFGADVDIIKPIHLKEELIKRCEQATSHHKEAL